MFRKEEERTEKDFCLGIRVIAICGGILSIWWTLPVENGPILLEYPFVLEALMKFSERPRELFFF